jgi:hypothetical protein
MNLSTYLVDETGVGDCAGQEKIIANNLNLILYALDAQIAHILLMGKETHYDPAKYHEIMSGVWPHWRNKKDVLLNLAERDIQEYVEDVCAKNTTVVCDKNVCSIFHLNELELMNAVTT